jgi:hypothetical protein
MRSITDGTEYQIPSTIDDATIIRTNRNINKIKNRIYNL